ncbi:MAG: ATP-binding protein [Bryobacterales bacterium]
MRSEYTRSGVRRAGDDYQDIIALEVLVNWLEHPDRYEWVRVEADDAGFLDDVVALRADGVVEARQVKFAAHPNDTSDPYTWNAFLSERSSKTGKPLRSLLSKWGASFQELLGAYENVEASLVSNRRPGDDLQNSFGAPGVVDLDRISDATVRGSVVTHLGGRKIAREFFAAFKFQLGQPNLEVLEEYIESRFLRLHSDVGGWHSLKDELRNWVRKRNLPPPDGRITLEAIKNAAKWQQLEALPEEFPVPADFVIPEERFHSRLKDRLRATESGCVVLMGLPGIGKSTYISNLYRELRKEDIPVIRHHYFLSGDGQAPFRYDYSKVAISLMSELRTHGVRLGIELPHGNPRPEDLRDWLSESGRQVSERVSKLVVILDGLDHVWRDAGSVSDLDRLFQLLTPIPRGVVLLLGTQPVDSSQLPRRLSEFAPKETWLSLPALEYKAVRRWAEIHASELRIDRDGGVMSNRLDELAGALWTKSEGHPLHLQYLLKSLEHVRGHITTRDILRLPDALGRDITQYYARFWEELDDGSKHVLCLLATCDFPWSRHDIAECLDPSGSNLTIDSDIRKVTHLTNPSPLGLQFAHTSLQFFVRQHADYLNYAPRIRRMVRQWLEVRAPDSFRWSYEWLLAAEDGDEQPLLNGPSRSWLIQGMARRCPTQIANRILKQSASLALQKGKLDRFVEIALLSDYLSEALDSRDYVIEQLLASQLAIREDETILDRARGATGSLGNQEILALAEYCQRNGLSDTVKECLDRLNSRMDTGQTGGQDLHPRMNPARCLARTAAFAPGVEPRKVLDWVRRQQKTRLASELWDDYTDSLKAHRQSERLRGAVEASAELTTEKARAFSRLVVLGCEEGFDPLAGREAHSGDPFVVVAKAVRGEPIDLGGPVDAPDAWVLRLSEYEFYEYYDAMADYFWRMLFVFTANCLLGKEDQNISLMEPFAGQGWISTFMERSAVASSDLAQRLRSKDAISYSWVFEQFSEIRQPDFAADRTGHGFAVAARKAIFRLAMDLQALQAARRPPTIELEDIEIASQIPLFLLDVWMELTLAYRRNWFAEDALAAVLRMIESKLGSTVQDFGSRAELCARAAELAASHDRAVAAAKWVRECWSNLLAYGYHKDMLLDQCLDAAEHLQKAGWSGDAIKMLERLAPAISAVGDYTDGDHTRHFPAELGRLLFKADPPRFVRYHEWLGSSGEYWDAHSIFQTFVAEADLGNRVFRAVAETAVETNNLSALQERSSDGNPNAAKCLRRLSLFRVPEGDTPQRQGSAAADRLPVQNSPMPDVSDFPPENFEHYLEAARAARHYIADGEVDKWAKYWGSQGHKAAVLAALEVYDSKRSFSDGDSKLRFDLTMEVRGKDAAYRALIQVQRKRYGWNRYFSPQQNARYVWTQLSELYPDKWLDFLQSTLMSDPDHVNRSSVTVHSYISRFTAVRL